MDKCFVEQRKGRPCGEVRRAIIEAADRLTTPSRAPTMRELCISACVGWDAGKQTIENLVRYGVLVVVRTRQVEYRGREVAEYAVSRKPMHHVPDIDACSLAGVWR